MKPLITLSLILFATACFAQRQYIYYLQNDGRYILNRDQADYIRVVREPDSASVLYKVFEYYPNGSKKLVGKSTTINPPKYEGLCITYYKNGKNQTISNYKNGILVGECTEFYPNGKPYLVKTYSNKQDVFKEAMNDYLVTAEYDSLGTAWVTDGNGYYKGYNSLFTNITDEGNIKNGKRNGQWKGYDPSLKLSFHELYENGKLLYGVFTAATGDSVKYKKTRSTPPQFDGDLKEFANYLRQNIVYPSYEKEHRIQGKVILSFIVETDGTISGIKILNSVSENIDKEAERVVQEAPGWEPGEEYGRKVRSYFVLPISFTLSN